MTHWQSLCQEFRIHLYIVNNQSVKTRKNQINRPPVCKFIHRKKVCYCTANKKKSQFFAETLYLPRRICWRQKAAETSFRWRQTSGGLRMSLCFFERPTLCLCRAVDVRRCAAHTAQHSTARTARHATVPARLSLHLPAAG